jgi:hypothetical protein
MKKRDNIRAFKGMRAAAIVALMAVALVALSFMAPHNADAFATKFQHCKNCHVYADVDGVVDVEIYDGSDTTLGDNSAAIPVTVAAGTDLDINYICTATTAPSKNKGMDYYVAVPTGWGVQGGDPAAPASTLPGWNIIWDETVGVNNLAGMSRATAWSLNTNGTPDFAGTDSYTVDFEGPLSPYSVGSRGCVCDDPVDCTDPDGTADISGVDLTVTVGSSSGTIYINCIGHDLDGQKNEKAYTTAQIDVTISGGGATTTVGDGSLPGNKYAGPSDANVGVSTFTLSTDTGTDTVTAIDVTGNAGSAANLTSVSIYDDSTGTTPNEWDASDTFIATNTGFTVDVANFTGLSINVTTTSVQYIITDTINGAPTNGQTVTGYVSSISAGNTIVNNDNTDATITIDALAPAYTWNTPAAGTYYKDTDAISVDADITEAGAGITNGANCTPLIDGASASFSGTVTYATGTGKCTGTLTLGNPSALSDGAHNLTLEVADDLGNTQQSAARSINIDNTAPVTTDDVPAGWQASDATVTLGTTETGSGVLQTLYCVDTINTCTPVTTYSVPFSVTCTAGTACTQYVRYYSDDNAGNQETPVNSTLSQIDKAAPGQITVIGESGVTTSSVDLTWTDVADTGSGNASYDVRYVAGASFVEGQWAGATDPGGENTPPTTGLLVGSLSPGTEYTFAVKTTDNAGNQSVISATLTRTTSTGASTTVGDGGLPGDKYAGPSDADVGVSTFTLSTSTGTDTVTDIVVTGTNTANVAASGVEIYDDSTGTTPNEWDASDTTVATASFSGATATFSGLSINVTTSPVQYIITYDIAAAPTDTQTLTGFVNSVTTTTNPVTNNVGNNHNQSGNQ